jgi:hypothetical protein
MPESEWSGGHQAEDDRPPATRLALQGVALLVAALLVREAWALLLPLDVGNDELFHLYTARLYHSLGRLAVAGADSGATGFFHPVYGFNEVPYLFDPPAAHWLAALALGIAPRDPTAYLWLRQLSALGGSLAAMVGYLALRVTWPIPSPVPVAAGAVLAFMPQAVFMGSYFNDDWSGLLAAATVYCAVALVLRDGLRARSLAIGAAGLALVAASRLTYWPVAIALAVAILTRWRNSSARQRWGCAAILLPAGLIAGAWIARNQSLYHAWDGGQAAMFLAQHPAGLLPGFRVLPLHGHVPARHPYLYQYGLGYLARGTFMSFWGVFGYMGLLMPAGYYLFWALFCAAGIAGLGRAAARLGSAGLERHPRLPLVAAYLAVTGAVVVAHIYFNLLAPATHRVNYQPQGRYLFAALLPIVTLLILGLRELARASRHEGWLAPVCVVACLAANVWCLATVVAAPWSRVIWAT